MKTVTLNNTAPSWPSVAVGAWTPDAADFPMRIALGGHRYQLVERTPMQRFCGPAFWTRLVGVVQSGEFAPWLCFVWRPRGRFDYVDQRSEAQEPLHALMAEGGALYVRVDG